MRELLRWVVVAAAAVWVGRFAVLELASFAGRRRPRGPAPKDSLRAPGRMPGPFDDTRSP